MSTARLVCVACGAVLSGPVTLLPATDPQDAGLRFDDGDPLTEPSEVFTSTRPFRWSMEEAQLDPLQFTPQHWMNPADFEMAIQTVADAQRLSGCCGMDGCNGPNIRCRVCGAEVGTWINDCWTPNVFIPEPAATRWMDVNT